MKYWSKKMKNRIKEDYICLIKFDGKLIKQAKIKRTFSIRKIQKA